MVGLVLVGLVLGLVLLRQLARGALLGPLDLGACQALGLLPSLRLGLLDRLALALEGRRVQHAAGRAWWQGVGVVDVDHKGLVARRPSAQHLQGALVVLPGVQPLPRPPAPARGAQANGQELVPAIALRPLAGAHGQRYAGRLMR